MNGLEKDSSKGVKDFKGFNNTFIESKMVSVRYKELKKGYSSLKASRSAEKVLQDLWKLFSRLSNSLNNFDSAQKFEESSREFE